MIDRILALLLLTGLSFAIGEAKAQPAPSAAAFVDPISVRSPEISPNGRRLAYIARSDEGERIVVVDLDSKASRALQQIRVDQGNYDWLFWKGDDRLIVGAEIDLRVRGRAPTGSHRPNEDFNYSARRIVALNVDTGELVELFSQQSRQLLYGYGSVFFLDRMSHDRDHVMVEAWDNDGTGAWRANITTGHVERIAQGSRFTYYFATDGLGNPVIRVDILPDRSGLRFFHRAPGASDWTVLREVRRAAAATNSPDFDVVGAGPGAGLVYVLARAEDRDFAALHLLNTATGEIGPPLQQPLEADASEPWIHTASRQVLATCEIASRRVCSAGDRAMQRHLNALDAYFDRNADVSLVNMSDDGARWLIKVDGPTEPTSYFIYEPASAKMEELTTAFPGVDRAALSPTEIMHYQSRDGSRLWAYLTDRSAGQARRPMVVMPHGGPEARDHYGYDAYAQFLASRGYLVLQPNFRGSRGQGRAFADAGRGQWGRRMQDDVTDAVLHLIQSGRADPGRICIVGASYGGYAALAGVTLTPDLYACAISIAGVSDLISMLGRERSESGGVGGSYQYWRRSIGDPVSTGDQLAATSPRRIVSHVRAPVLLMHGEEDETVPITQSEMMERALDGAGRPTRLIRFAGESHYWDEWSRENRHLLFQETERFLAQNLGEAH